MMIPELTDSFDLVLFVVKVAKEVKGRTRLQKIIYFLSKKLGLDLGFIPHYFGPYSPLVGKTLESLISADFIEETAVSVSTGHTLFIYKLKPDVDQVLTISKKMGGTKNLVKKLAKEDANKIIMASKVHYLFEESGDRESLPEKAKKYGWNLDQEDISNAFELLSKLRLIQ